MKLTIGMAHYNDYNGVFFTTEALRMYHDLSDVEILVVDNSPTTDHGKAVAKLMKGFGTYVEERSTVGTCPPRDRIFREAAGELVVCVDCHELLSPGAIASLLQWSADNPQSMDLITGPMIGNHGKTCATHWDLHWKGGMCGTWGMAWACKCGWHFTLQADGVHDLMHFETVVTECPTCGLQFDKNKKVLIERGCRLIGRITSDEPFEIPCQGLGLFGCRKEAWLGFNPNFRGFSGGEGYIHEKFRQAGRRCLCLPAVPWVHRFDQPDMTARYKHTWYERVRNYVIGRQELAVSIEPIHDHFVTEKKYLSQERWDHIIADPVGHVTEPQSRGCCGGGNAPTASKDSSVQSKPTVGWLAKLVELASQCKVVVEFGHKHSTITATLLAGHPQQLYSFGDLDDPELNGLKTIRGQTDLKFATVDVNTIDAPRCDLLFADLMNYDQDQVAAMLSRQASKVSRWIALYGTKTHGDVILPALRAFFQEHPEWTVVYHSEESDGLTVIGCLPEDKPPLPSLPRMIWNYAKAVAKHHATGGAITSIPTVHDRMVKCSLCPQRTIETRTENKLTIHYNRCSGCGCYLTDVPPDMPSSEGKLLWADSFCPFGYWTVEG